MGGSAASVGALSPVGGQDRGVPVVDAPVVVEIALRPGHARLQPVAPRIEASRSSTTPSRLASPGTSGTIRDRQWAARIEASRSSTKPSPLKSPWKVTPRRPVGGHDRRVGVVDHAAAVGVAGQDVHQEVELAAVQALPARSCTVSASAIDTRSVSIRWASVHVAACVAAS